MKMMMSPPCPSGVAEGAWTPDGVDAPKLKRPAEVTTSLSRSWS